MGRRPCGRPDVCDGEALRDAGRMSVCGRRVPQDDVGFRLEASYVGADFEGRMSRVP